MRRLGIPRLRNGGCKHVVCRPKPASNRNLLNTPNGSQAPRARAGKAGRRASLPHASALPGHALTGPSTARHSSRSGRCLVRPDTFEVALLVENGPGDTGKLVGERDGEHVVVQPLLGGFDPGLEPMALPALWLDQHNPRRLDEQDAQVAIATLRYLAENYAIPSRGLLGDKPQPSGEVAAFAERIAIANGSYHCAGDDRPDPRHAHQPLATGIPARDGFDLARQALDALIEPAPVASQFLDRPHHARREDIGARTEDLGELSPQETQALADCNAALQEEGADLVDDAGALADQALAHAIQRLQVELFGRLGGNELHRRALNGFGDRLGIAEVVLLPLGIRTHVLRRHQPGIVTKHPEPATEVMGADAGFHADQARRNVRESCLHLATRPLLPQRNCAPVIEAHDVERVLADIDANHGNRSVEFLRHGVLLALVAPMPALLPGGAGARPDHSITGHGCIRSQLLLSPHSIASSAHMSAAAGFADWGTKPAISELRVLIGDQAW